jgi:hypothetical protein
MRQLCFYLTAVLGLACVSCGANRLHPVSGKVVVGGFPAAGAAVFFHRQGGDGVNDPTIMGIVGADGSFELVCGAQGKGAPAGEYDVLIEWKPQLQQGKGTSRQRRDRLRGRYADPKNPFLHATIGAGDNRLPPFDLVP